MKPVVWLGDSLLRLREFPRDAMHEAGYQLERVQTGREPKDWKPMPSIGPGVNELRVRVGGAFRVLYVARFDEAIYVLSRFSNEVPAYGAIGPGIGKGATRHPDEREKAGMKDKLKRIRSSGNVFLDMGFDKAAAENLKLRSDLMMRIDDFYRGSGMTQAAAAKALGITQPRLNALLKGKIGLFSLDALVNIATRAGLNVRLVVKKAA